MNIANEKLFFFDGNNIETVNSNWIMCTNLLNAIIVFLVTMFMVDCYFKTKYGNSSETMYFGLQSNFKI